MKKAPKWGRAIGIIMIILGSFGVFFQLLKTLIPSYMRAFSIMVEQSIRKNENLDPGHLQNLAYVKQQWTASDESLAILMISGIIGVLLLIFYIIGGAKLLKAKELNFQFAKYALIVFILFNAFSSFYFLWMNQNGLLKVLGIYIAVGTAIDIVLLSVALTSKKTEYGGEANTELNAFTLNPESEEII